MTKIYPIFLIPLLFIPMALLAQIDDFWLLDEMFFEEIEEEITLESLELFWSADTYVPFGYQGRALPTKGSLITVEADLKISTGNSENLKYSWFLDDIFQEAKSGYGQDSFKFYIRRLNRSSHRVLVKIFNESRSFFIEKSITIPITAPDLVIYQKNDQQINLPYLVSAESFEIISDKEFSFLALPYFFNINSLKDLEFKWSLGDKSVKESSLTANIFGLKIINKEVGGFLKETIKVLVTNKRQSDQRIEKLIKLNIF